MSLRWLISSGCIKGETPLVGRIHRRSQRNYLDAGDVLRPIQHEIRTDDVLYPLLLAVVNAGRFEIGRAQAAAATAAQFPDSVPVAATGGGSGS